MNTFLKIIESIMQYKWNELAINRSLPTITAKDGSKLERPEDFSRVNIHFFKIIYYTYIFQNLIK